MDPCLLRVGPAWAGAGCDSAHVSACTTLDNACLPY